MGDREEAILVQFPFMLGIGCPMHTRAGCPLLWGYFLLTDLDDSPSPQFCFGRVAGQYSGTATSQSTQPWKNLPFFRQTRSSRCADNGFLEECISAGGEKTTESRKCNAVAIACDDEAKTPPAKVTKMTMRHKLI